MIATTPEHASKALSHVADQIGRANYARHLAIPEYRRPKRYSPTEAHRDVVAAILDVLNGRLSVNDAFALIHRSDVEAQRFGQ